MDKKIILLLLFVISCSKGTTSDNQVEVTSDKLQSKKNYFIKNNLYPPFGFK